ncbi:MAG: FUSC family protein [Xanthobacteraceae bacterium]|nr:FUSC family protein [Xanthobacteraceae bacterium]
MLKNVGFREIIFSVNCFIAVAIALFIAFRLNFTNPWWAMIMVYLTSQPLSGTLRAKAIYRILGTLIGGIAMLVIIPNLVDAPELAAAAVILWVALCVYASVLDRTPGAYALAVAGFTAALVGFPTVLDPDSVFDIAIARMEEITLGTLSAALVHSLIFPRSAVSAFLAKQAVLITDTRRWISDGLAQAPTPAIEREQRRIAADVTELATLALAFPYDTAAQRPNRAAMRALDEQLVAMLPRLSGIEDRIAALRRYGSLPDEVAKLIAEISRWFAQPQIGIEAQDFRRAGAAIVSATGPQSGWADLLTVSLVVRLDELIDAWQRCLELSKLAGHPLAVGSHRLRTIFAPRAAKPLHRDHGIAALSALTAAFAMTVGTVFWIATAWPNGDEAVGFVAVACSLFAALDDPSLGMLKFIIGTVGSVPIVAIYQFGILPAIDGYTALMISLAPALLPIGIVMAIPKYASMGLALAFGFSVQLAIQPTYSADMATFLNSSIAVVLGFTVGVAVTRLIRALGAQTAARRLLRAGREDLADLADGNISPTRAEWTSRMLDRVGLLLPRMRQAAPRDVDPQTADALHDLRTGINLIDLKQVAESLTERGRKTMMRVLTGAAGHFRSFARGRQQTLSTDFLRDIDVLIGDILVLGSGSDRTKGLAAIVGLRRDLYPDAPPYIPSPLPVQA